MNQDLRQSFDRVAIPAEAVKRWNGDPASLTLLGDSQNFVYRFQIPGAGSRILRITPASHRTPESIGAELEFITYLKSEECNVAGAIPSADGKLIEPIGPEEGAYHAAVFEDVGGVPLKWGRDEVNRRLLFDLGRWLGRLHAKSHDYQPQRSERFHWFEDDVYKEPEAYLPESEAGLRNEMAELFRWLNRHPATRDNYGLVHGDLWATNFRLVDGKFVVFDFDDCCYHWFAYDIAVAIAAARRLPIKYRKPYLQRFLEGYTKEYELHGEGLKEIEWFGRLAAMQRYITVLRLYDPETVTPQQQKIFDERRQEVLEPITWC